MNIYPYRVASSDVTGSSAGGFRSPKTFRHGHHSLSAKAIAITRTYASDGHIGEC